jgi:hypothetical protein
MSDLPDPCSVDVGLLLVLLLSPVSVSDLVGLVRFSITEVEAAPDEWSQPRTLQLSDRLGKTIPGAELEVQVFSAFSQVRA